MFNAPDSVLEAQSFRECDFYIRHLLESFEDANLEKINESDSISKCLDAIQEEIDHLVKDKNARNTLINKMKAAFKAQQLSDKDFLWLNSSDERFCNWVWCYLDSNSNRRENIRSRSRTDMKLLNEIGILNTEELDSTDYNHRFLSAFKSTSNNTKDRYKDIIEYFHISELNLDEKKTEIERLISAWQPIFNDKRIVNWLETSNSSQYDWAWDYIEKFNHRLLRETWSPTNDKEKKQAIISLFDLLHDREDSKSLLIGNMKRAWNQKNSETKMKGKKPIA